MTKNFHVRELQLVYSNGRVPLKDRPQFTQPADAAVCLDTKHRLIGIYDVGKGSIDNCLAAPSDVFTIALLARAAAVIVTHNHPSGDHTPSSNDVALTSRLIGVGELIGIPVLDHVITGDGTYFSFKTAGQL